MDATGASLHSFATRTSSATASGGALGRSRSSGPRLSRRGLVTTTSAALFTGAPPAPSATLRDLAAEPDFAALESRQRAVAARRVELLRQQAALAREAHGVLSGPEGMLHDSVRHVNDTKHAISYAQRRGIQTYYASPGKIAALDAGDALGARVRELRALEAEVQAGHEEERALRRAMANLNVGAVEGRGPRAGQVTSLATWRSVYGSPAGHLAAASPGYATEWRPSPRMYGGPNSPLPHGHKRQQLFPSFASAAVTLKLGRDLK
jgi:hypothetical protein